MKIEVSGREITLKSLTITDTYIGCLVGSLETLSHSIRRRLDKYHWHGKCLHRYDVIQYPKYAALPPYQYTAEFESTPAHGVGGDHSTVRAFWFAWTVDVPQEVEEFLESIVWKKHAKDSCR